MPKTYRAIVIGPTGAGKSQFCNFVQRDTTNKINEVNDSLISYTQNPRSNYFTRQNTNYEFIDTPGRFDSSNNTKNLEKLVNYLKEKKTIDYIILLFKFERITNQTREYIDIFGKIFTPTEFFTHLCVFLTMFPKFKSSKKKNEMKTKSIEVISEILKESFKLSKDEIIPKVNVYYIDTEYDEDKNGYDEKYQDTIDIMLEQMKLNLDVYPSINTTNIDISGVNAKIRAEYEKKKAEELIKKLEEEKKRSEEEVKREKKNYEERREKELKDLLKKKEEERKWEEEIAKEHQRKFEEEERKNKCEFI